MKKIINILALLVLSNIVLAQNGNPIFSINNGVVITNNQFINPQNNNIASLQFTTNKIATVNIKSVTYDIKVGRFNGWGNEPGDFDVIQLFKNGNEILTFKDINGIAKLNNQKNLYSYNFNELSNNGYFIETTLTNSSKILIFLGQHYGSDLPELIIFMLTEIDAKLVYCKKMSINSIHNDRSMIFNLQSNIIEDGVGTPITHRIWLENGVLMFANN